MGIELLIAVILGALPLQDSALARALREFREGAPGGYRAVVACGEPAVPELLALLADTRARSSLRFTAANALGEIGAPQAYDGLAAALGDADFNVRRCAALALGWLGDARAQSALEKLAAEDPYSWIDPADGSAHPLVRADARRALATLARWTQELADASQPPALELECEGRRLAWPFAGGFREQNPFNNYQQPTDSYLHAGLDLLHPQGSEVRAVEDGWVRLIDTNYPDWKTHHYFVVTREKDGLQGFAYTHVDPDSYRFALGEHISKGQVLGRLVDFSVGARDGVDHLHLDCVELAPDAHGRMQLVDIADPLLFFDARDESPPRIEESLHAVHAGSLLEFSRDSAGVPSLGGRVDLIAGFSDSAWQGQSCNWGVPVVTLELRSAKSTPWRRLVCDLRGRVGDERASGALFVDSKAARAFGAAPTVHWMQLAHTDGDGRLQAEDARFCWDTRARLASGAARFPDGEYELIVRAWDLAGQRAQRSWKLRVRNAP